MPIVYADDFTGAAALGGALRELSVASVVVNELSRETAQTMRDVGDVLIVNAATRDVSAAQTETLLAAALAEADTTRPELLLFRVDSTMRGNIAATVSVARDFLMARTLAECLVFVSIANPDAGRTVEHGLLRVWGELASDTELAQDPTWNVTSSNVGEFLFEGPPQVRPTAEEYVHENWALIDAQVLEKGVEHSVEYVVGLTETGVRTFVVDGRNTADADTLAHVVRRMEESHPVSVLDSGPGLQALLSGANRGVGEDPSAWHGNAKPVVVISGSSTQKTHTQVEWLKDNFGGLSLSLLAGQNRPRANLSIVGTLARSLTSMSGQDVITLDSSVSLAGEDFGPQDLAESLELALTEVAKVCVTNPPAGLVLVGGETCLHFLAALSAVGIRPGGVLEPLMPFGTIVGGPLDGMPVVTKGGLVGSEASLGRAVAHLRDAVQPEISQGLITELQKEGK